MRIFGEAKLKELKQRRAGLLQDAGKGTAIKDCASLIVGQAEDNSGGSSHGLWAVWSLALTTPFASCFEWNNRPAILVILPFFYVLSVSYTTKASHCKITGKRSRDTRAESVGRAYRLMQMQI